MIQGNEQEYIRQRVHDLYYGIDMNCARTTLTILGELLDVKIEDQTMDAALGLHGAGGFRAQCGLVEGALMFIGIWGRLHGKEEKEIVKKCYEYADSFTLKFGSLTCRELRPGGFQASDPPHLCENLTGNAISFAYKYVTDWIPVRYEFTKEQKSVMSLLKRTYNIYRTGMLRARNITDNNTFNIHEYNGIYYLYEYVPYKKLATTDKRKQELIRCFYSFTRGEKRSTQRMYRLYYKYVKKFLWLKNIKGSYTLSVIPSTDPGKENPLKKTAGDIVNANNYLNTVTLDGRELLRRTRSLSPVNKGNTHSVKEHMDSMIVTEKPATDTVILLDDIVNSGNTGRACCQLLKDEGVKHVYVLCLFTCRK